MGLGVYFLPLTWVALSRHSVSFPPSGAAPPSQSLPVTSVNELEEGRDEKRLLERHLASTPYSTPPLFHLYVCVCVCGGTLTQ